MSNSPIMLKIKNKKQMIIQFPNKSKFKSYLKEVLPISQEVPPIYEGDLNLKLDHHSTQSCLLMLLLTKFNRIKISKIMIKHFHEMIIKKRKMKKMN